MKQIDYLHTILDEKFEKNDAVVIVGIKQKTLDGLLDIAKDEGKPFVMLISEMIDDGIKAKKQQEKRCYVTFTDGKILPMRSLNRSAFVFGSKVCSVCGLAETDCGCVEGVDYANAS